MPSKNNPSDQRYARQVILPEVGEDGQAKLARARVLVIGLGGLGSPASLYLAAAGVGTLGLADHDSVDITNLHRQILHSDAETGAPKVESARKRLAALNPDVALELVPDGITIENAVALIDRYDLVIDGTDNFPARYLINDAAYLAGKPVVHGSIYQFEGQVTVFDPAAGGPCYRCLFPDFPDPETAPNCAEAGVFGALCGIVGSWQANEAIKRILGIGESMAGKVRVIDAKSGHDRLISLEANPACPLCGSSPRITSLEPANYSFQCGSESMPASLPLEAGVDEVADRLSRDEIILVDVRQPFERDHCRIGDGPHIPLPFLANQWQALPKDQHLIIYCHHGRRSLSAASFLRKAGLENVQSMVGGIEAWSLRIDPSVPRY